MGLGLAKEFNEVVSMNAHEVERKIGTKYQNRWRGREERHKKFRAAFKKTKTIWLKRKRKTNPSK